MEQRTLGIDVGADTVKVVELRGPPGSLRLGRRVLREHHKDPRGTLERLLEELNWGTVTSAAVSGRLSRQLDLLRVPTKQAQSAGYRFSDPSGEATIVSIGGRGFSVLELRASGAEVFRENSRCSQGTGNFLCQLVERFGLDISSASTLCEGVADPAPLSGRCPVILKTDMTHLANKGEGQARILAGLYDAVCENVQVLIKPRVSPPKVLLIGGVSRSGRIRENFARFLDKAGMSLMAYGGEDALFLEALGCAAIAAEQGPPIPSFDALFRPVEPSALDRVPGLALSLPRIRRLPPRPARDRICEGQPVVLGFDIGSTGSKAVALDPETRDIVWEGYISTAGNPVRAAQTLVRQFLDGPARSARVLAFGTTGSGREIAGSLLSTCYGCEAVFVLNEIAAHAEGARFFDPRVDTIFEIGGQDAKYIRLSGGRVVDAAMNEACSAGTGSFIEEQGSKFSGIDGVVQLGHEALRATQGVSLGQHCSVFMAEIIDEAVAAGEAQSAIVAGLYDSVIQNYLNRVKGPRSVGDVIFCQGMPFSSDALAGAVARQTGSEVVVPPNPGTIGALGIALLTLKQVSLVDREPVDLERFLSAELSHRETFVCNSTKGCEEPGNHCRIDRIRTLVDAKKQTFTWGGGCSLWDARTGKTKLPDRAPDPFRQRADLIRAIIDRVSVPRGRRTIALSEEFNLKGLFPFFATYFHELGYDVRAHTGADQAILKRGIEEANVPYCAPMQQFHGLASSMADESPDYIFMPMLRSLPRVADEEHAVTCPIVQASPDLLRWDLSMSPRTKILSPVVDFGIGNLASRELVESIEVLAKDLGAEPEKHEVAFARAVEAQTVFDLRCLQLGRDALEYARQNGLVPVVVLGRPYTVHNSVLNSNVPAILREQGTIAVPGDCYPVDQEVPVMEDMYWGYSQRNLRAAAQIRRTSGVYSLWCSNYSCGPDSFNLHFYTYLMEGKPFAVIETDGHSGDAGTKTRVEAFLHCVREDLAQSNTEKAPHHPERLSSDRASLRGIRANREKLLFPRMGAGSEALAAALRSVGLRAESLPMATRESVAVGRRYTSGKECIPLCITMGSFIERLEENRPDESKVTFFIPKALGPCRFGVYNILQKLVLERIGYGDRVRLWSPVDTDYFEGVPRGLSALILTGFAAMDILIAALYDVRPVEAIPGEAQKLFERYKAMLVRTLEAAGVSDLSLAGALLQVANGRLFGVTEVVREAASAFARIKTDKQIPTVAMVGEIYVRCDPFANDYLVKRLESHGLRVRFAPFSEWLEYTDFVNRKHGRQTGFGEQLSSFVQRRIQARVHALMARELGWAPRTPVRETLEAARPYMREELFGEAVLTIGDPVHQWELGTIDGAVNVGPLECMPCKIGEAQLFHVAERHGLPVLNVLVNGDPIDPDLVANFAFDIKAGFEARRRSPGTGRRSTLRVLGDERRAHG